MRQQLPEVATLLPPKTSLPTSGGSTPAVNEVAQAAVRVGVQMALAAQVAQDGLQQSLTGNRQTVRLTGGIATRAAVVETTAASFAPLLNDVGNIATTARVGVPTSAGGVPS